MDDKGDDSRVDGQDVVGKGSWPSTMVDSYS